MPFSELNGFGMLNTWASKKKVQRNGDMKVTFTGFLKSVNDTNLGKMSGVM